ncbi:Acetyltransferase [Micromonospora saelicesensis]|uniref:Acetyltransferase n=1 Tax=Micromonospora saelicesensis TaxID=285676 RepID=A0A328NKW6_9ACTN|nr:GNAT family N-acetyltransferase [Micromonospora saelicesensis]RAO33938.1 Acetyltransferase [Micromonospora saelicesensis]
MPVIRSFSSDDYEAVCAVWTAAGRETLPRREITDPSLMVVAQDGDRVCGVVMGTFDGRRGWILRLAVHPQHRRRGIATRLVAELGARLRRIGCLRANLLVLPDNAAGLAFWQRLGYLPCPDVLCTKPLV